MKDKVIGLISKAEENIKGAKLLFAGNLNDIAASRCYYAMFYVAKALVLTKGFILSSHRGVISTFSQEFIKTGIIAKEYHTFFTDAFDKRQIGDYGTSEHISEEEIKTLIKRAEDFLNTGINRLKKEGFF